MARPVEREAMVRSYAVPRDIRSFAVVKSRLDGAQRFDPQIARSMACVSLVPHPPTRPRLVLWMAWMSAPRSSSTSTTLRADPITARCSEEPPMRSTLLMLRAENVSDHRVLEFGCSRATARIDKHSDRHAAILCIRVNVGGQVITRPAAAVTIIPAVR
jgi:hypothetical protein